METQPLPNPSSQAKPSTTPSAAPAADTLTVWEAKERAGLLALETEEWRQKRMIAESPNTTADVLERLAKETKTSGFRTKFHGQGLDLIAQAVIVHPNTPPATLIDLIKFPTGGLRLSVPTQVLCRTLCRNPIAPFLCLEVPDFWMRVGAETCQHLLSDANLPEFLVEQCAHTFDAFTAQSALLHVSRAGEIDVEANGFRTLIKIDPEFGTGQAQQRALNFAPVRELGSSADWKRRLTAALTPPSHVPLLGDPWNRSSLDLLHHLARDGNCLVRWAAQTRLANHNFTFTWHEGMVPTDG